MAIPTSSSPPPELRGQPDAIPSPYELKAWAAANAARGAAPNVELINAGGGKEEAAEEDAVDEEEYSETVGCGGDPHQGERGSERAPRLEMLLLPR